MNASQNLITHISGHRAKQSGFSLTEIVIALTLGLFVAAGLGQLYIAGRSANRIIDSNSLLNENGRFATEYFARTIRFAGYYSCGAAQGIVSTAVESDPNLADFFWFDYEKGVEGFRIGTSPLPAAITDIVTPKTGTDLLVVRYADILQTALFDEDDLDNAQHKISLLTGSSEQPFLKTGDIAVLNVAACDQTTLFQVTGVSNSDGSYTVSFADSNTISPGNCTTKLKGYPNCDEVSEGRYTPQDLRDFNTGELSKFITQAYFIANDPVGCAHTSKDCPALQGCPTLFTAGTGSGLDSSGDPVLVPILRNVTDMKIEFGVYESGTTDNEKPQTTSYKTATETIDWNEVNSLRLSLEVHSDECASKDFHTTVYLRNAPAATPGRRPILD